MRAKRLRSNSHGHGHGPSADGATNDEPMDPSLMTERQQLAFLLRKTAQDAPSSPSSDSSNGASSADEDGASASLPSRRRPVKRAKPRARTSVAEGAVVYCGRGRPPKNSIKLPAAGSAAHSRPLRTSPRTRSTDADADTGIQAAESKATTVTVPNRAPSSIPEDKVVKLHLKVELLAAPEKPSPSSASDVALLACSSSPSSAGSNAPPCALCCDLAPFCDAPLFLCPACDQKYPTQQALGRVCMT
ncbi:hypothetical protein BBJ28_00010801 [Nothophytophthora sp. Chile5]|nr:hypothetical protein BBJ28_00010801 [Nothophytophthora sp. Chile5]